MSTMQDAESGERRPARATWRQWLGLGLLTLPMLALATDISVLFLAMPSIGADLQPNTSQMLWILHVYGFFIAGLLITMGRLGDRIGRRRLLLLGAAAFAGLAAVAAWSTTPTMLIIVRALLGVAGATLMPSCYSLLRPMFQDAGQRRFAIAVMFGAFSVGSAIGPLLGGLLLSGFWWGSVFLVNVPPLALLLLIGPTLLPEHRDAGAQPLDLPSVALSLAGMLAIIYGLQETAEHGPRPQHALMLLAGLFLAWTFVGRQRRLTDPLLDLRLFANRRFSASVGMMLFSAIGALGGYYLFTQYLQWVVGLTPLRAGLATLPFVLTAGVGALLGPAASRWADQVHVIGIGLVVAAIGYALAAVASGAAGLVAVMASFALAGLGSGAAMALGSDLIISTAPAQRTGSAAAMQEISGELGTALGVAVGGSLGMLVYRTALSSTVPPEVPAAAVDAARASVPGALAAAELLPATLAPQLLDSVQDAFTQALQVAVALGALVFAGVAALVVVVLRRGALPEPTTMEGQAA